MSQTSVGSGTPNDRNENPAPSDGYPSRTFGAESSPPAVPAAPAAPLTQAVESDAVDLPSPLDVGSAPDIPDGPNVAPSAWEVEAAQGEPDRRDPAPKPAGEA
jgi:hypothetical protein